MLNFLKKYKLLIISLVISVLIIFVDQITKILALNSVNELIRKTSGIHNYFEIFPFLNITLVYNRGISFGIFSSNNLMSLILIIIIFMIILYVIHLLYKSNSYFKSLYLSLILGGAIGNFIDRFKYGAVVDFIDFHIYDWHFPVFNFADIVISLSFLLILLEEFVLKKVNKN